uniref:Photosystem I reaction center subunit III n=1 Tax=Olisthodiscus luteus TaxID=83000 RepID=A0A7U0KSQ7_OLILU|nr:photosystem I reaction center subunit III [Olisthodiscus luteus]QQW50567.1 photosystem I reaction center subunit III [Olisthodiscus luteus]
MKLKKIISILFLTGFLCVGTPYASNADSLSTLTKCGNSPAFQKRLDNSVKKLEGRLKKYDPNSPAALSLRNQIERTKVRFERYGKSGLLCGREGLPHLITDGRWDHAAEFVAPGLMFLYITGWIGWVGRAYLQMAAKTKNSTEKEIIIDVPYALSVMFSGFTWPIDAWTQYTKGELTADNDRITVSPR